jgi:hypothetical protein
MASAVIPARTVVSGRMVADLLFETLASTGSHLGVTAWGGRHG